MDDETNPLADEIATTLRGMIEVPLLYRGSQIANPDFWSRCRRIDTDNGRKIIFVDGFAGSCRSNSWKVFRDALEPGLSLWLGYACCWDRWVEHAWCMLGDRIIETTVERAIYYGAELTLAERDVFGQRHGKQDLDSRRFVSVVTFIDGKRQYVPFAPAEYAHSIGRERDPTTRQVKAGLGR